MKYSSTEFASIANVTKKSLRHYDKIGLLSPTSIDDNGYWYYNEEALNYLQLIKNLQVLGFTLKEIKNNGSDNFETMRENIIEKKRFLDEEMIRLQLAKRLLCNIESKPKILIIDALNESLEEEHIDWYKRNLSHIEYQLLETMMSSPNAEKEHQEMLQHMKEFKLAIKTGNTQKAYNAVQSTKEIFILHLFDETTSKLLIEFILKSNLEGPLSSRILSVRDVILFIEQL